jgi:hypothetical protein
MVNLFHDGRGYSEDYHEGYGSQGSHALPSQEPSSGVHACMGIVRFLFQCPLSLSLDLICGLSSDFIALRNSG